MGLVKLPYGDKAKYLPTEGITAITPWTTDGKACACVWYGHVHGQVVDGTPDEVHAALFPEPLDVEFEGPPGVIANADIADALDPATYAQEWQNYSPEKVRAMVFALGLVRARLGVGT